MIVPALDFGNSPWNFPIHVHWDSLKFTGPDDPYHFLYSLWCEIGVKDDPNVLGWASGLRFTMGKAQLSVPDGYMGHIFVGRDLSWIVTPDGAPIGIAPHDLRYPPSTDWECRGAWVDDRASRDAVDLGKLAAHEVEHLMGRPGDHPPWTFRQTYAGSRVAFGWAASVLVPIIPQPSTVTLTLPSTTSAQDTSSSDDEIIPPGSPRVYRTVGS